MLHQYVRSKLTFRATLVDKITNTPHVTMRPGRSKQTIAQYFNLGKHNTVTAKIIFFNHITAKYRPTNKRAVHAEYCKKKRKAIFVLGDLGKHNTATAKITSFNHITAKYRSTNTREVHAEYCKKKRKATCMRARKHNISPATITQCSNIPNKYRPTNKREVRCRILHQ